jgi:hypothetical protein
LRTSDDNERFPSEAQLKKGARVGVREEKMQFLANLIYLGSHPKYLLLFF